MNGILLILYVISVALSCMVLGLAITFRIFHKTIWSPWYIAFQSCIVATIMLGCFNFISFNFFHPQVALVFSYIFEIMMHTIMGGVCFLIPYFLKWMLGIEWKVWHWVVFSLSGLLYFASGLVSVLIRNEYVALIIQSVILFLICLYAVVLLWMKLKKLPNKQSQKVCIAFNVTCICLIPLLVLSFIFEGVRAFCFPAYVFIPSIVMLVYFYVRFNVDSERNSKKELGNNTFEKYKVTDRELSVIKLICDGLTNKEIASELNISVNTVNNHVANIFEKVGARSRVDLLKMVKTGPWD